MTRDQAVTDHIALTIGRKILAKYEADIRSSEEAPINGGDLVELVCYAYDDAVTSPVPDRSLTGEDRSEESEAAKAQGPPYVTPKGIILTEARVDEIFAAAQTQSDYVDALHGEVIPRWNDVETVNGFVHCGPKLNQLLIERAIDWDREHKVPAWHGGLWMNCGFSASHEPDIRDWEVRLPAITYKPKGE